MTSNTTFGVQGEAVFYRNAKVGAPICRSTQPVEHCSLNIPFGKQSTGRALVRISIALPWWDPCKALFLIVPAHWVWLQEVQEAAGKQQQVLFGRVPAALIEWKLIFCVNSSASLLNFKGLNLNFLPKFIRKERNSCKQPLLKTF